MSVDIISKLIFINRDSIGIQHNQITDVLQGPAEDLNNVTEKWSKTLKMKQMMTMTNKI